MATFFTHWRFFYHTVVYFLLIYVRLTICAENLFLLHPLIASLALKQQLFCFSASSSPACLFLDAFRRSFLLLVAVIFTVVSLSIIRCRPSRLFHSLTSASPAIALPFSRLFRLPVAVVGFLVVLLFHRRPLIRLLQLVVAIIGQPLIF